VDVNYLSAGLLDWGLYLHPQDYATLCIPAEIDNWIFSWWAKKILMVGECFPIHEIRRIDGRRGFQTRGNVFRIGGNIFYDRKNKIPMKILEFKRSGIGLIAGFCGILNGFSIQAVFISCSGCRMMKPHDSYVLN
jgi:hypothetical protein